MHEKIEFATALLLRAQTEYQRQLDGCDALCQSAVSQDPANLDDVVALQATYGGSPFTAADVSPLLQP